MPQEHLCQTPQRASVSPDSRGLLIKRNAAVFEQWTQLSVPLPQCHFCCSFPCAPHFLTGSVGVCRLRAQGLGSLRAKRGSKTLWQAEKCRCHRKSAADTWALLCSRHECSFYSSPAPRGMSVTWLKDTGEPREREPFTVARFHAVSLIFCLASEIHFSRRWERTWNKIDLGWANIWQRSVGNNHLSWEISTPGDIDGTKNICLSPQSHSIQFSSMESFNPSAVNLSIYFYFWSFDLPGGEWKALVCSRCSHTSFWCLGWVETREELQRDN